MRAAFPWLGAATCYKPKDELLTSSVVDSADNESQLLNNKKGEVMINGKPVKKKKPKKKKNNLGDEVTKANPIAKLGFGIVAYVDLLWVLIWTFTLYTIMLLPTLGFFGQGSAYDNVKVKSDYLDTYLGNLGYSSVQCASIPTEVGKLALSCPYGSIGEILDYGVNPLSENRNICINGDTNEQCKPGASILAYLNNNFIGKDSDLFTFDTNNLYRNDPAAQAACLSTESTIFVQFTCVQAEADQALKYEQMALTVGTACLIALLFTISMRMQYQGGKIQQLEWDMSTVTAGDFAVEMPITKAAYDQWKDEVYRAPGGPFERQIAPALALKETLVGEIEEKLQRWIEDNPWATDELYGRSKKPGQADKRYEGTKVADITFSFNNAPLILALRERGAQIAAQDFDKMREAEAKVSDLFQDFETLTVPTSAFVIFESDDTCNLADEVKNTDLRILNMPMHFNKCSEPTDIIWENRHYTSRQYFARQCWAFTIIAVLLFGSAIFIYWISAFSAKMAVVYPPVECDNIAEAYGTDLQQYAVLDYDYIQANPGLPSSGCLQCFCQQEYELDADSTLTNSFGQVDDEPICDAYYSDAMSVYFWTTALSYLLIGINYILRTVCIMLVDWIGYATETERLSKTTTITFIVQYFNSAYLLLMVNANMSEQPITFGLTTGAMPDFNSAWFRSVGDIIVAAMVFNVYYPAIEAIGYWALRWLYRCLDRGCKCKGDTKSTSIQGYISLYQGPIYFMHYKYSSILTICYMTFMYGFGMPVLFPIALASFIVLYICERIMFFYAYVMPPMYDERLSNDVLNKLQFAPLLYVIFGYWMASNQQLLSNDHLTAVPSSLDVYVTDHTMTSVFQGEGWANLKWPLLCTFLILNLIWYFGNAIQNMLYECFPYLKIGDVEINEEIDSYWASLDEGDRKWSTMEEENTRSLKFKILTDGQYSTLKNTAPTKGKTLQGVHSFDILANPLYLDDFQYVTAAEGEDRAEMIIDDDDDETNDAAQSDLVRFALNLAYVMEDRARNFSFNKNGFSQLMDNMKPGLQ